MDTKSRVLRWFQPKIVVTVFSAFILTYLAQSLLYAPSAKSLEKYQVSSGQLKIVALAVAVPYIVIWIISVLGYRNLWRYNTRIAGDKDGNSFKWLTLGVLLLAFWLPVSAVFNNFTTRYAATHIDAADLMVQLNNYSNLVILFIAYTFLFIGARQLAALTKKPIKFMPRTVLFVYALFAAWYIWLVLHDAARSIAVREVEAATYYQSDPVIILTIIIPRLAMWLIGLAAVYKIYQYKKQVKGTLYKEALTKLAVGLGWIVVTTIILRLFQTVPIRLSHLNLGAIVLVVYLLLLLLAIGYILLGQGAKRLERLEEI